jgi:hypothetical protein
MIADKISEVVKLPPAIRKPGVFGKLEPKWQQGKYIYI